LQKKILQILEDSTSTKFQAAYEKFPTNKGGLAIVAMRHWSQELLQSPVQNVKKGDLLEAF
jgi:hypothetical protein